jgi:hypothetical protein
MTSTEKPKSARMHADNFFDMPSPDSFAALKITLPL